MRFLIVACACLLLVCPAAAQQLNVTTGSNGLGNASPLPAAFVTSAAQSDMFEIQSSRLAMKQGAAAIKPFAKQMIADHTKTTAQLKRLVNSGKVKAALPPQMSGPQKAMLTDLTHLKGNAFDKQYATDQVNAHQQAIALFQSYGAHGQDAALRSWAAQTLPMLRHHLQMANSLPRTPT